MIDRNDKHINKIKDYSNKQLNEIKENLNKQRNELRKTMQYTAVKFNKDTETLEKNEIEILKMKNSISYIKISVERLR
jgi:hypothetical protein